MSSNSTHENNIEDVNQKITVSVPMIKSKTSVGQTPLVINQPIGSSSGGFFEINLPENWGTIRLWAEQQQVEDNGYEQYVLRFNDQKKQPGEPKPLAGNQILFDHLSDEIKESNKITVCTGSVKQTFDTVNQFAQPKESVNIKWNEYSYDPGSTTSLKQQRKSPWQFVHSKPLGQFEEILNRRGDCPEPGCDSKFSARWME